MITRLPLLFNLLLMLCAVSTQAQNYSMSGFSNFNKEALTPIYVGSEVQGYTMFYRADQADKRHYNFGLDLFDQNLQKLKNVTITKEGYLNHLLQTSFNGSAFGLYYYNSANLSLELEVYDKALNKITSKQIPKPTKADKNVVYQQLLAPYNRDNRNIHKLNLYAVPDKGFIRNSFTSGQKGFMIEMYDNNLDLKWSYRTDKKSKFHETLIVNEITGKYLLATIARKPFKSSRKITFAIAAFDIESGKKVLDLDIKIDNNQQLLLGSFSFDSKKNEFIASGEFYAPDAKVLINPSKGLFVKRIGLDGKDKSSAYYEWEKDIQPLLPQELKKNLGGDNFNFVHKVVKGADGKYHVVTEQYKVKRDGLGLALAFLGSVKPTMNGIIGDLVVYTVDANMKLSKVDAFEKEEAEFGLPRKIKPVGNAMTGLIINMTVGFDYQFTQNESRQSNMNLGYIRQKKVKGSKYKEVILENVLYTGTKGFATDKIDVSSTKEKATFIYPAKTGYVMVLENEHKDKKLEMKLVKLNR